MDREPAIAALRGPRWLAVTTLLYFVFGLLGRFTIIDGETMSMVWPAAGVAMLAFALAPRRQWLVISVLLALANVWFNLLTGARPVLLAPFVAANLIPRRDRRDDSHQAGAPPPRSRSHGAACPAARLRARGGGLLRRLGLRCPGRRPWGSGCSPVTGRSPTWRCGGDEMPSARSSSAPWDCCSCPEGGCSMSRLRLSRRRLLSVRTVEAALLVGADSRSLPDGVRVQLREQRDRAAAAAHGVGGAAVRAEGGCAARPRCQQCCRRPDLGRQGSLRLSRVLAAARRGRGGLHRTRLLADGHVGPGPGRAERSHRQARQRPGGCRRTRRCWCRRSSTRCTTGSPCSTRPDRCRAATGPEPSSCEVPWTRSMTSWRPSSP